MTISAFLRHGPNRRAVLWLATSVVTVCALQASDVTGAARDLRPGRAAALTAPVPAPIGPEPEPVAELAAQAQPAVAPVRGPAARLSPDARLALAHVLMSQDNAGKPYVVIDKRRARMWAFDAHGDVVGSTPVLLGLARGDDTVPGVGNKPLAAVLPTERTTPAGRFVAEHGRNAKGDDVMWVDYDAAVSIHRVKDVHPWERRLQRLKTRGAADNRISYGCINVPTAFYDTVLLPLFAQQRPVVYLLPETRPVLTIFPAVDNSFVWAASRPGT